LYIKQVLMRHMILRPFYIRDSSVLFHGIFYFLGYSPGNHLRRGRYPMEFQLRIYQYNNNNNKYKAFYMGNDKIRRKMVYTVQLQKYILETWFVSNIYVIVNILHKSYKV